MNYKIIPYIISSIILTSIAWWTVAIYSKPSKRNLSVCVDRNSELILIYTYYMKNGKRIKDGDYYKFFSDMSMASKRTYKDGKYISGSPEYFMASSSISKDFFDDFAKEPTEK